MPPKAVTYTLKSLKSEIERLKEKRKFLPYRCLEVQRGFVSEFKISKDKHRKAELIQMARTCLDALNSWSQTTEEEKADAETNLREIEDFQKALNPKKPASRPVTFVVAPKVASSTPSNLNWAARVAGAGTPQSQPQAWPPLPTQLSNTSSSPSAASALAISQAPLPDAKNESKGSAVLKISESNTEETVDSIEDVEADIQSDTEYAVLTEPTETSSSASAASSPLVISQGPSSPETLKEVSKASASSSVEAAEKPDELLSQRNISLTVDQICKTLSIDELEKCDKQQFLQNQEAARAHLLELIPATHLFDEKINLLKRRLILATMTESTHVINRVRLSISDAYKDLQRFTNSQRSLQAEIHASTYPASSTPLAADYGSYAPSLGQDYSTFPDPTYASDYVGFQQPYSQPFPPYHPQGFVPYGEIPGQNIYTQTQFLNMGAGAAAAAPMMPIPQSYPSQVYAPPIQAQEPSKLVIPGAASASPLAFSQNLTATQKTTSSIPKGWSKGGEQKQLTPFSSGPKQKLVLLDNPGDGTDYKEEPSLDKISFQQFFFNKLFLTSKCFGTKEFFKRTYQHWATQYNITANVSHFLKAKEALSIVKFCLELILENCSESITREKCIHEYDTIFPSLWSAMGINFTPREKQQIAPAAAASSISEEKPKTATAATDTATTLPPLSREELRNLKLPILATKKNEQFYAHGPDVIADELDPLQEAIKLETADLSKVKEKIKYLKRMQLIAKALINKSPFFVDLYESYGRSLKKTEDREERLTDQEQQAASISSQVAGTLALQATVSKEEKPKAAATPAETSNVADSKQTSVAKDTTPTGQVPKDKSIPFFLNKKQLRDDPIESIRATHEKDPRTITTRYISSVVAELGDRARGLAGKGQLQSSMKCYQRMLDLAELKGLTAIITSVQSEIKPLRSQIAAESKTGASASQAQSTSTSLAPKSAEQPKAISVSAGVSKVAENKSVAPAKKASNQSETKTETQRTKATPKTNKKVSIVDKQKLPPQNDMSDEVYASFKRLLTIPFSELKKSTAKTISLLGANEALKYLLGKEEKAAKTDNNSPENLKARIQDVKRSGGIARLAGRTDLIQSHTRKIRTLQNQLNGETPSASSQVTVAKHVASGVAGGSPIFKPQRGAGAGAAATSRRQKQAATTTASHDSRAPKP